MKILLALTYYHPHISGLTVHVKRLAEGLAAQGHHVTVLTSRYSDSLRIEETLHNVTVVRVPVVMKVHKGLIMPLYIKAALTQVKNHEVTVINVPNTPIEAFLLPVIALFYRKPAMAIYHCDICLPRGIINRLAEKIVRLSNRFVACNVDCIAVCTQDYVDHSRFLSRFSNKIKVILPPVSIQTPDPASVERYRRLHAPDGEYLVGFIGRLASEKGVEYLIDAVYQLREHRPRFRLILAGQYQEVIFEQQYWHALQIKISKIAERVVFLGQLNQEQLATFYAGCDVIILPSVNSTESFGLVQAESMLCGTPVIASDMPGVRTPVSITGMGLIVPPRNADALAQAIVEVVSNRHNYIKPLDEVREKFSFERCIRQYDTLFYTIRNKC
jgi:glycosyltransferase involved in cell wall biosynthesis